MYTKEQLIHESVKVLKVAYYLALLLSIKVAIDISFSVLPRTTKTIKQDATGKIESITVTTTYGLFGILNKG